MKKTFTYKENLYKRKVKFTGAYAGVLALFAFFSLFWTNNFLLISVIVVGGYTYWNVYGSLSNPQEVRITEKSITFSGCGMVHNYNWKDIYSFQLKEFPTAEKVYLRINEAGLRRGRYWINYGCFSDGKELYTFLRDKEYEIHPNSTKSQARRTNEAKFNERQALAKEKEEAKRLLKEEKAKAKELKKQKNKDN